MVFGDFLAIGGLLFSALVFYWFARTAGLSKVTISDYLLASRTVGDRQFGSTMIASSTSLATVLIFFISTASLYGYVLLFCGASYFAGQVMFLWIFRKAHIETGELTTNADFVRGTLQSPLLGRLIVFLTVTSFLMILFLELYIGSGIVRYYFPGGAAYAGPLAFGAIGLLIIAYVRLGGLGVVIRTDNWQLNLMLGSMCALFLFSLLRSGTSAFDASKLFAVGVTPGEALVFCAWIALLNFTLPFTQLSSWQRLAATRTTEEAWTGLLRSAPRFFVIWWLPVIALVILSSKGVTFGGLSELFDTMRATEGLTEGVLYPVLFVGFASALFSTGDTAMIALQLSVSDQSSLGPRLEPMSSDKLRRFFLMVTIATVVALAIIYSFAEATAANWFMPVLYAIFSQLTISAPIIVYAVWTRLNKGRSRQMTSPADLPAAIGLILGWLIFIGATVGKSTGKLPAAGTQEFATYLSVIISGLGVLVSHLVSQRLTSKA